MLSGLEQEVARASTIFSQKKGCLYIPLKVSGAFHSRQMKASQDLFSAFMQDFTFNPPTIPVIANINAKPYEANHICNNLVEQISNPVRWSDSITYLLNLGESNFEEIGPGKVLSGLVRKIKASLRVG